MSDSVTIVMLGQPVSWARARTKGKMRFTPAKQRVNGQNLVHQASIEMRDREMFTTPVQLTVRAEFRIPSSWSMKKKNAAILGQLGHGSRPDLDNIVKQVNDAFNDVVWSDDKLVSALIASKTYSNQPKLVITVTAL